MQCCNKLTRTSPYKTMMLFRFSFQHGYNLPTLPMILYAYIQYNIMIHNLCPFLTIYHRLGMLPQILQQSSSTGWYSINMEFANESNICEEWPFLDKGILINHHIHIIYIIYLFMCVCHSACNPPLLLPKTSQRSHYPILSYTIPALLDSCSIFLTFRLPDW